MEQMIGQCLGRSEGSKQSQCYQIKSLIGKQRGRRTFLAEDAETKVLVVLKLILFGPDFTWEDLKLFEREAETLKSLDHAAIPNYLDSFEVETALGKGFALVQTYIAAKSLQEWVTSGRRFSESDLKTLTQEILVILQYLHSRHPAVVHRDIKPSNILLGDRTAHSIGSVYLVDFGSVQVAHHGGTMTVVGTYGYMPPEQFGGRTKPTSDLYSLGATLLYLATGQHPADFAEDSLQAAITTHLKASASFTQWIRRLIQSNAAQRTPSAEIALHDLSRLQPNQSDRLPSSTEHPQKARAIQIAPSSTISSQPINSQRSPGFVSVAESAFQVELTAKTFTVRFDQNRIREKLECLGPYTKTRGGNRGKFAFSVGLGIIFFAALLIVAVSGATAGIALLFSAFFIIITTVWAANVTSSTDDNRTAIMTLTKSPEASVYLTVEVLQVLTGQDSARQKVVRSPTQFTNVPLQAVHVLSDTFGYHASFTLSDEQTVRQPSLKIAGNQRRLKSLLRYINQWDSSIVGLARNPLAKKLSS